MLNRSLSVSTCVLKDLLVELDIKRQSPSIFYISAYGGDVSGVLVRFHLLITLVSTRTTQSMTGQSPSIFYISAYGGDVSGNSGQISSPNYPRQYPHNTEYDWTLT